MHSLFMCGACTIVACYTTTLHVVHVCLPINEVPPRASNVNIRELYERAEMGGLTSQSEQDYRQPSLHNGFCCTYESHNSSIHCCVEWNGEWCSAEGWLSRQSSPSPNQESQRTQCQSIHLVVQTFQRWCFLHTQTRPQSSWFPQKCSSYYRMLQLRHHTSMHRTQ